MLTALLWSTLAQSAPYAVVLGIAQDAGHPQAGCDRTCCATAWVEGGHRVSTIGLVDPAADAHWLLDASPDFPAQEQALPGRLAGVLPTHAHIGHYTGLMHLGREVMGADGVPVWVMPRMKAFLESNGPWNQLVRLGNVALKTLSDGVEVVLSPQLKVTPIAVPHRDEYSETVGFVVQGPSRRVLYLPDIDKWSRWDRPIESLVRSVDRAWLDGTFFDNGELPGRDMSQIPHPFIAETMDRLSPLSPRDRAKVHFIHFNHTNPVLDASSAATAQVERAGHHIARQGDRIDL
jgi:pyrroloquinoline quinone biosynthesis protein B